MKQLNLSKRLSTAVQYVRSGAIVADIGTDHAYIPIYLTLQSRVKYAIASDINQGPLLRAKENIKAYNLEDKIATYLTSGLDGIEKFYPTDVVICGMGGELIADIIDKSDYVKGNDVNLVLQPMTSVSELRAYLQNGFDIIDEDIVFEDGKFYQIICAKYDGKIRSFEEIELELGRINIAKRKDVFLSLLDFMISKKEKVKEGLLKGGCDITQIQEEIEKMEKLK